MNDKIECGQDEYFEGYVRCKYYSLLIPAIRELTWDNAPGFQKRLKELCSDFGIRKKYVIFDMHNVLSFSSVGVASLLSVREPCPEKKNIHLCEICEDFFDVLTLWDVRADDHFVLHDGVESAFDYLDLPREGLELLSNASKETAQI